MESITIQGELRSSNGSADANRVRKSGRVPAVVYGDKGNIHLTVDPKELKGLIYTPQFKLAQVAVDGSAHRCILKDVQFHPVTDEILHADFMVLEDGRKVKVEVPVVFEGTAVGVKSGGKLVKKLRRVKIKANAEDIVPSMTINVSALKLGQSIRVKSIQAVEGIEIVNSPSIPVASVEIPRSLRSEESRRLAQDDDEGAGDDAAEG